MYQHTGENRCRRGGDAQQPCCSEGFAAATGWDPVSGFGSIRFRKFKELFLDMTVIPPVSDGKKDGETAQPPHPSTLTPLIIIYSLL